MSDVFHLQMPSTDWPKTTALFEDTLGFQRIEPIKTKRDCPFGRKATLGASNGFVVEIVEHTHATLQRYKHAVLTLHVHDVPRLCSRLVCGGMERLRPINPSDAVDECIEFRGPDGTIYRLEKTAEPCPHPASVSGIEWILAPTEYFEQSLDFFDAHIGLSLEQQGRAKNDPWIDQYAMFRADNGVVVEVISPKSDHGMNFEGPVVSVTVHHLPTTLERFRAMGVTEISDIVTTEHDLGWFYFRIPGGPMGQIQGSLSAP